MPLNKMQSTDQPIVIAYAKLSVITPDPPEEGQPLNPVIPWIFAKSKHIKSISGLYEDRDGRTDWIIITLDPSYALHMTIPRVAQWGQLPQDDKIRRICQDIVQVDQVLLAHHIEGPSGWDEIYPDVSENGQEIELDVTSLINRHTPGSNAVTAIQVKIWTILNPDRLDTENPGHRYSPT